MDKHKQVGEQGTLEQPSKENVRAWLRTQVASRRPPPDPAAIRRELGWELIRPNGERKR